MRLEHDASSCQSAPQARTMYIHVNASVRVPNTLVYVAAATQQVKTL